ncbi:MAG: hypothetical protein ACK4JX_02705 [Flavobacterium sp.]
MKLKAAIVEPGSSHEECMDSWLLFLQADYQCDIVASDEVMQRIEHLNATKKLVFAEKSSSWKKAWFIYQTILKNQYDVVIFNTCQGNVVRNICWLPKPKKAKYIGLVHDGSKLLHSGTQKIISKKIHQYFVLAQYIAQNIQKQNANIKVDWIYLIFNQRSVTKLSKNSNEIWITVPGRIHFSRKNYEQLLDDWNTIEIPENWKLILLGSLDPNKDDFHLHLSKKIKQHPKQQQIITFNGFIPYDTYESYITQSDFILPYTHAKDADIWQYNQFRITGSYASAFGKKIPLVLPEKDQLSTDFQDSAYFYSTDWISCIHKALQQPKALYQNEFWEIDHHTKKLKNYL